MNWLIGWLVDWKNVQAGPKRPDSLKSDKNDIKEETAAPEDDFQPSSSSTAVTSPNPEKSKESKEVVRVKTEPVAKKVKFDSVKFILKNVL